jgi:hypothetical protein
MKRRNKLLIAILISIIALILVVIAGQMFFDHGGDLTQGEKKILVCAVDQTEERPGMGAVDMAYIITLENGSVSHYTPIYPHGMRHPTKNEPTEALNTGARDNGGKMLLHDALWYNDTDEGVQNVKEIVEYNKSVKLDAVVLVNVEAADAIVKSAGPLEINGTPTVVNVIDFVREDQHQNNNTRGQAIITVVEGLSNAVQDPATRNTMMQMAITQYNKGNIVVWPKGSFIQLLYTKGFNSIVNN